MHIAGSTPKTESKQVSQMTFLQKFSPCERAEQSLATLQGEKYLEVGQVKLLRFSSRAPQSGRHQDAHCQHPPSHRPVHHRLCLVRQHTLQGLVLLEQGQGF